MNALVFAVFLDAITQKKTPVILEIYVYYKLMLICK